MKLITLNTFGGKYVERLIGFIKQHINTTDIFCFQEVFSTSSSFKEFPNYRANLLEEFSSLLPNFICFFDPVLKEVNNSAETVNFNLLHGLAIFIKKDIKIENYKSYFLYKDKATTSLKKNFSNIPVNIQCISFIKDAERYTICNFHGASFPGAKLDTKQRIEQSKQTKKILKNIKGAKIITGDFNLLPNTQSILLLEEDFRNLIKEFNVEKTRSRLSPFFGGKDFQKFADYTFVSKDIKVSSFQVPHIEISDHLPMILEFS